MTKTEMLNLVDAQLESYNCRAIEGFCACYHPEIKLEWLVTGRKENEGLEKFKAGYLELFKTSPHLKCELKSRIIMNETVIDEEWVTGASAFPYGLHATAIYGFRDGLIDRVWFAR